MPTRFHIVVAALAVVLVGCGGNEAADEAPAGDAIKVGLVTDVGQLNDKGFNQLAFQGLKQAERRLGVDGRVLESTSSSQYVPNLMTLAREGYDLIIGVGYAQGDAVDTVATRFPKARFLIIDVDQAALKHKPKNVVGLLFKEEEVGYLAGYLAARAEKRRPGPDVISSVGGFKEPPVDRFIAGYQAGARAAAAGIKTLNGYSNDWDDQLKCKELALNHIAAGAGVVFQVAGGCGLGALDATDELDVWGIGVDADQSFLGPHVLTSAMKKVDRGVYLAIESVLEKRWRGGRNLVFGLAERGVGLGRVSEEVPREDVEAVKDVADRIVAGEIDVPRSLD